jgi:hypothetical protein
MEGEITAHLACWCDIGCLMEGEITAHLLVWYWASNGRGDNWSPVGVILGV